MHGRRHDPWSYGDRIRTHIADALDGVDDLSCHLRLASAKGRERKDGRCDRRPDQTGTRCFVPTCLQMTKIYCGHQLVGPTSTIRFDKRIGDIEVLRAFAIVLVLYEHADPNLVFWQSPFMHATMQYFRGWVGVDLFFAISGFVIARSLLPLLEGCSSRDEFIVDTARFWIRRAWRLLPSAWLWLLVPLILCVTFNRSDAFMTFRADADGVVAAMLDVANFRLGMIYGKDPIGSNFIYWSLSLEEQFYFLLPMAVFIFRRRIWMLLSFIVALQFVIVTTPLTVCLRGGAITLGVLLAIWQKHPSYRLFEPTPLANYRSMRVAAVGVPLIFITMLASYAASIVQFPLGMIAILSAFLVWLSSYDKNYICRDGFLKKYSYGSGLALTHCILSINPYISRCMKSGSERIRWPYTRAVCRPLHTVSAPVPSFSVWRS